jgi:hypothetical protein
MLASVALMRTSKEVLTAPTKWMKMTSTTRSNGSSIVSSNKNKKKLANLILLKMKLIMLKKTSLT